MKKKISFTEAVYSFLSTLMLAICTVLLVFMLFFRIAVVDGNSMNPTLYHGDKIIISGFLYSPDYGDIIVIGNGNSDAESIIKRIIALPGDTVDINFDSHIISVNGKPISEDYKLNGAISEQGDVEFPLTVPENSYFVLGDNRNNSLDSRYSSIGCIPSDSIIGKALFGINGRYILY